MTLQTFDQVLMSARQLAPCERARLIAHLAEELAAPPASDGLARFHAFVSDFRATYPHADVSGRLEADRRERDAILQGETHDVHT